MNDKRLLVISVVQVVFIVLFAVLAVVNYFEGNTQTAWYDTFAAWFSLISAKLADLERKMEAMK